MKPINEKVYLRLLEDLSNFKVTKPADLVAISDLVGTSRDDTPELKSLIKGLISEVDARAPYMLSPEVLKISNTI